MNFPRRSDVAALERPGAAPEERSLQTWLAASTFVICAAIAAIFSWSALHERSVAVGVANRAAANLAASFAQQTSDTCEAVDGALLALAERIETDGSGPRTREALRLEMASLVTAMPRLHGLLIVDERGRLIVSNSSAAPRPELRFGGEPYFRYHRDHPVSSAFLSGPRRSETDDVEVIDVTRRFNHADGSFAGVAIAQIEVNYFSQSFAAVDLGPSGTAKLIGDDGTLMVREPAASSRSLIAEPIFADPYKYQTAGAYIGFSDFDGVLRLRAFRRVDRYPLVIVIALAERDYLAQWLSAARAHAVVGAFVVVMIVSFSAALGAQIGRRKRAEECLVQMAHFDGLTGIANRRQFDAVLEHEWRRAERDRTPLGLLIIDVDNFKDYNDMYGHVRGDEVLIAIASGIAAGSVRPGDFAARYGGEEFAVILPRTDAASAVGVGERIRRAILDLAIPHAGVSGALARVSVSVGAASVVPDSRALPSLLVALADAALYDSKRLGRNQTSMRVAAAEPVASPEPAGGS